MSKDQILPADLKRFRAGWHIGETCHAASLLKMSTIEHFSSCGTLHHVVVRTKQHKVTLARQPSCNSRRTWFAPGDGPKSAEHPSERRFDEEAFSRMIAERKPERVLTTVGGDPVVVSTHDSSIL